MTNPKDRTLKKRSVGEVAAFKPDDQIRRFLEDFCALENRTVSNAIETIILGSRQFQEWISERPAAEAS